MLRSGGSRGDYKAAAALTSLAGSRGSAERQSDPPRCERGAGTSDVL